VKTRDLTGAIHGVLRRMLGETGWAGRAHIDSR
jgi:hypothetical protein